MFTKSILSWYLMITQAFVLVLRLWGSSPSDPPPERATHSLLSVPDPWRSSFLFPDSRLFPTPRRVLPSDRPKMEAVHRSGPSKTQGSGTVTRPPDIDRQWPLIVRVNKAENAQNSLNQDRVEVLVLVEEAGHSPLPGSLLSWVKPWLF